MTAGLSPRQAKFCEELIQGKAQSQAYRDAGYKASTDSAAETGGSKLVRIPKVVAYLAELQQETKASAIATRSEVMEVLSGQLRDESLHARDRREAGQLLTKLEGWAAPDRLALESEEVSFMASLLAEPETRIEIDGHPLPTIDIDAAALEPKSTVRMHQERVSTNETAANC